MCLRNHHGVLAMVQNRAWARGAAQKEGGDQNETIGEVIRMVRSGVQRNRIPCRLEFATDVNSFWAIGFPIAAGDYQSADQTPPNHE